MVPGNVKLVKSALNLVVRAGNEVAASKRAEKITNAPASIYVIGKKELGQFSGSNIYELFSNVQGIESVRTGVDYVGGKVYWGDDAVTHQPRYYIKNFDGGPLGGFTIIDLSAGYKLNNMINLNMGITNLFNAKQLEFVGSPYIGRLISLELKVHVPNKK